MSGLSKFPKFVKHNIFCTTEAKFRDVDIGNLFFHGEELYIRVNYPAKRMFARNAVIVMSPEPGLCGIGLYLDAHDDVEIVTESSISLRGDALV